MIWLMVWGFKRTGSWPGGESLFIDYDKVFRNGYTDLIELEVVLSGTGV